MTVAAPCVEHWIALGFGLSMVVFFIGQGLRYLTDAVDTMIKR